MADLALKRNLMVTVHIAAIISSAVIGIAVDGILTAARPTIPVPADGEDRAAAAVNPKAAAVDAPTLALDTRRLADLALERDLVVVVVATVFAVAIVGFASDGLLGCCKCRNYQQSESNSEITEKGAESHSYCSYRLHN
jgi:hypothetical protein